MGGDLVDCQQGRVYGGKPAALGAADGVRCPAASRVTAEEQQGLKVLERAIDW